MSADRHHITRIDITPDEENPKRSSTHGWQVRVRRQGKRVTKFFADRKHGGRDEALEVAKVYRDELLEELPEPDDPVKRSAEARSRSGVAGLNLTLKDIGNGTKKPYVQLSWIDLTGKRRSASFSAEKWGLRRAIWNACLRLHKAHEEKGEAESDPYSMFKTAYPRLCKQYIEETKAAEAKAELKAEAEAELEEQHLEAEAA